METAVLSKRVWMYIINLIFYVGVGFGASVPIYHAIHSYIPQYMQWHIIVLVGLALGIAIILSFAFDSFLMKVSKGYTIGSAICGVKFVSSDGQVINGKQIVVRSMAESILILAFLDLIYFLKNRTERGVIDRLSDTFAIDNRR